MTKLVMALVALFIGPILTSLFGGFGAWLAGIAFEDTFRHVFASFGLNLDDVTMFQLGATLGFFGGFIRIPLPVKE